MSTPRDTTTPVPQPTRELPVQADPHYRHYLHAATAENTRRTYRTAIRTFERWGGLLPTTPDRIIRYLLDQAALRNPRTLALHLTALRQWHSLQGFTDPTAAPEVRKTLRGIQRAQGRPRRKATALRVEDLKGLVEALRAQQTLVAARDEALLMVGYFGAFRRSELVGISIAHLGWVPEGLLIELPRSKTDQKGEGRMRALPRGPTGFCPVAALERWLAAAGLREGPVFRAIDRWGRVAVAPLSGSNVNRILKRIGLACGYHEVPRLSSHSLRRGLSTSAARAGASFEAIKRQGGWRHDATVRGYIEEGQAFEDNAAATLLAVAGTRGAKAG